MTGGDNLVACRFCGGTGLGRIVFNVVDEYGNTIERQPTPCMHCGGVGKADWIDNMIGRKIYAGTRDDQGDAKTGRSIL